jgi:N-methylhydantoinase A
MSSSLSTAYLGVDTGGTFTDFVLFIDGEVRSHKCPSTPAKPELAILQGIAALDLNTHIGGGKLVVVHGSTVATNAALEGKGARTVFITNRGFADMLSIGRQTRAELYNLRPVKTAPPVPAELCLETGGRLAASGSVIEDLSDEDLFQLRRQLIDLKPEAVAINLLFSFIDPCFETAIAKMIAEIPQQSILVSCSSTILPEYKEYERGMATWLNAWLGPKVADYLNNLQSALKTTPLSIMQSSGGTTDAANAAQRAVNLLLSGPAGGLAAARQLGQSLGRSKLMTFDMGGTSSDVALINGDIKLSNEGHIGRYPVAVPMLDMHTIGAGGGSIAYIDEGGLLRVGPQSAGADPGPACYNKGGTQATVTDANLVLGRLPSDAKLGGTMSLNAEAARAVIGQLAAQLQLSSIDTAKGIIAIANEHMIRALRVISVQRGFDPAEFSLCSFGGAGGLHICALAEALGCKELIVPNFGGVFSALGMLLAPREQQLSRTLNTALKEIDAIAIAQQFTQLAEQGRELLLRGGEVTAADIQYQRSVDVCYTGQSYTLNVDWQDNINQLVEDFHSNHAQRYGHRLDVVVQLINIRMAVRANSPIPALPPLPKRQHARAIGSQYVVGDDHEEAIELAHYRREQLASAQVIDGPALISETVATTWLAANWSATVDATGHLLVRRNKL